MSVLQRLGAWFFRVPSKSQHPSVSRDLLANASTLSCNAQTRTLLPVTLRWGESTISCSALLDFGTEESFIDETFATDHEIPLQLLRDTPTVYSLDGGVLSKVHHSTTPGSRVCAEQEKARDYR